MGYESTLIFGIYHKPDERTRTSDYFKEYGTFTQIVSTIDLSKMGYDGAWSKLLAESPENDDALSIYYRDSDKAEREDRYGKPFKVLDPQRLIETLEEEAKGDYRRAVLAVGVVKAWVEQFPRFGGTIETPVILHYGH